MKRLHVYKYQGAGNDFVILDNRRGDVALTPRQINRICDRRFGVGADGLMTLCASDKADFEMHYYNADGPEGTMCGNGGRCIVAFADYLGIKPKDGKTYHFVAGDGPHTGEILADNGEVKTVRIRMVDVSIFCPVLDGWFVDTGTRHFVKLDRKSVV